ncbi:hypothetical protein [Streptomyces atratus]|uniref:hypothetical protein n=1 Tax=Streptomyces atratus TaxID=1893 RepID=UPI0033F82DDB
MNRCQFAADHQRRFGVKRLCTTGAVLIGRAALDALLPTRRRSRTKARTRKNPTSKYGPNAGQHPATTQTYSFHAEITFLEHGLATRRRS